MRRFRGWFAATYFPSVDLQQLCDSYHDEGVMGLPRELITEIMRYNDIETLKRCSLTSRAFYSAARPLVHRRMVLGVGSAIHGLALEKLPLDTSLDRADVFHARYLSEAEGVAFCATVMYEKCASISASAAPRGFSRYNNSGRSKPFIR